MNEQERAELARLKRRLESLRHDCDLLWMQTQQLEARLNLPQEAAPSTSPEAEPMEITPLAIPPLEVSGQPPATARASEPEATATPREAAQPPPLPPPIPAQPVPVFSSASAPVEFPDSPMEPGAAAPPELPSLPSDAGPAPGRESSFEMRLGTVWLVRIGIVMVLTALVFFGNYAYQNVIIKLGASGKVVLMFLGSFGLLGLGAWLPRKREALKNYAQVLFAGGLAAVYFTTYAAHHIETLRVIDSGRLDGLLLLAWAGFMAWLADRKKSELLALFAVGLAYYTSIITNIGLFTLYSNLVLTAVGVLFFVRNRWETLSFGSLLATYGGYAYWRFYVEGQWLWHLNLSSADYLLGNLFLLGYWLLFTTAVFLSRHEKFSGEPRAAYLTINNSAFFGLVILARLYMHSGSFWKFSLLFGAVLLFLAWLATRLLADERIVVNGYLSQGLLLVTLGFMTYFTGLKLGLVLAAESVILLVLAYQRKNLLLHGSSCVVALLGVGWTTVGMQPFDRLDLYLGLSVGLLMAFNAFWSRRRDAADDDDSVCPRAAFFSVLTLLTWFVATWQNATREHLPLVLAGEAVLFTVSVYWVRVPEIAWLGQLYLLFAQALWVIDAWARRSPGTLWWNPALLIVTTLGVSHWWQRQRRLSSTREGSQWLQGLYALAVVGLLFFWLHPLFGPPVWLAFASLLAVVLTVYGIATRAWLLAACGQIFLAVSGWEFLSQVVLGGKPEWYLPLAPLAALGLLSLGAAQWFERRPETKSEWGESILPIALVYRWVALVMILAWVHAYIDAQERFWVLALLGAVVFWWSGWRRKQEGLLFSSVLTVAGFWLFWFPTQDERTTHLPNLLAILLLLGQQRLARRLPEHFQFKESSHAAFILLGGLSLWRYVSKGVVLLQAEGFYLTVAWAALALVLFVAGLLLSERVYRWLGLGVLGCALGRVVIFDVWKLETLYRILSFMALGIVLLVLGFIYNRFQEKIKQWL